MSTWKRTEQAVKADAAAERLLAVHARCCRLAEQLTLHGDLASAAQARAIAEHAVADHDPVRINFAALALGISHADAVELTRDGTLPPAPWSGQLRVLLRDLARLLERRHAPTKPPPALAGHGPRP